MDIMDDYSDLDAWSDSLVQAAEDNLSSTRAGRSGEPDVLLGTPLSRARTPISVAGRRAGILPSKIPWGHDLDARRGEMGGSPVGTAKPRDGGGRDVDRNGNGGERSGSHVLRNGGSMSADTMTGDNIWMDL